MIADDEGDVNSLTFPGFEDEGVDFAMNDEILVYLSNQRLIKLYKQETVSK